MRAVAPFASQSAELLWVFGHEDNAPEAFQSCPALRAKARDSILAAQQDAFKIVG